MEHDRVETFTRVWATRGTRRALLGLLSVPALSGWLTPWPEEATEAAGRRKRRTKRHHHQRGDAKENRQGKRKGQDTRKGKSPLAASPPSAGCVPESQATTCGGRCASVTDNCGQPIDCGACDCGVCPLCTTCNAATGDCDPNPATVGQACGSAGICQANGTCDCPSCPDCTICNRDTGGCDPNPATVGQACGSIRVCLADGTCQCPSETTAVTLTFSPTSDPRFCAVIAHLRGFTPNSSLVAVSTRRVLPGGPISFTSSLTVTTDACGNVDTGLFSFRNSGLGFNVDVAGVSSGFVVMVCSG
jgi:hypothetical protein